MRTLIWIAVAVLFAAICVAAADMMNTGDQAAIELAKPVCPRCAAMGVYGPSYMGKSCGHALPVHESK